eukprot:m.132877 g.132877  ORF g.132877 m.132877 type:complete len:572 (-) comp23789_c0_seq2:199-1914(-)
MKFSLDQKTLAIQRTFRTIQFINVGGKTTEYSQSCKNKLSTHLLGFMWTYPQEIVFISNTGIELYQVLREKRNTKLIKRHNLPVNWFVYSHSNRVLLLSSSPQGNIIHPFLFQKGTVVKLTKFELATSAMYNQMSHKLLPRDVALGCIYGQMYCLLIKNNPKSHNNQGPRAEISVCQLTKDGAVHRHTLVLDMSGRFAINIVDNLILVHHQTSKTSTLFDIKSDVGQDKSSTQSVVVHEPILPPRSIQSAILKKKGKEKPCDLYASSWIVFQPDIIIDAKLGLLWTVSVNLEPIARQIADKEKMVDFLLRRKDAKLVLLRVIKAILNPKNRVPLRVIARVFDQINSVLASALAHSKGKELRPAPETFAQVVLEQEDLYTDVFNPLDVPGTDFHFVISVLVEYIRSLGQFGVPVQHFLYELVINLLVRHDRYYQLHQFLQYHVVTDSKHVACLLLSLDKDYPPAFQLALDMLKRLSTANEEIFDVLLSKGKLLPALRFMRSLGTEAMASVSARRFLEVALASGDHMLFYTVFRFFEQRNLQLRKKPQFAPGEDCQKYVDEFRSLFGKDAVQD